MDGGERTKHHGLHTAASDNKCGPAARSWRFLFSKFNITQNKKLGFLPHQFAIISKLITSGNLAFCQCMTISAASCLNKRLQWPAMLIILVQVALTAMVQPMQKKADMSLHEQNMSTKIMPTMLPPAPTSTVIVPVTCGLMYDTIPRVDPLAT